MLLLPLLPQQQDPFLFLLQTPSCEANECHGKQTSEQEPECHQHHERKAAGNECEGMEGSGTFTAQTLIYTKSLCVLDSWDMNILLVSPQEWEQSLNADFLAD